MLPYSQPAASFVQAGIAAPDESDEDIRKTAIAATICRRIKEAKDARAASGIEQIWQEDLDQYEGYDALNRPGGGVKDQTQVVRASTPDTQSRVYLNITKPKTDAGVARVQELLVPHDDKPWEIGPTPVPELQAAADGQDQRMLTLADGQQAPAADVAKAAMAQADEAAEKMQAWVEDQLIEGNGKGRTVYAELRKVIEDAGRLGAGVLKGPFPTMRTSRRWTVEQGVSALQVIKEIAPTSKRIDLRDLFPDPACGENIHNGSYICERAYMTARQLKALAELDGYDRAAIAAALLEGSKRGMTRDGTRHGDGVVTTAESDVYEVWYYYGDMTQEDLDILRPARAVLDDGYQTAEDDAANAEDPDAIDAMLASVPVIATMLNDRPIKVAVNPLESGEFPYDVFTWEAVADQWAGRGIPRKMAVAQRMLNASVRAMLRNAGLSAGAQIAIVEGAMRPLSSGGTYAIQGDMLWGFTPNEVVTRIQDAMHVWTIPSVQKELAAIIEFALAMADQLTNLPMLLQGQMGAAPDTVGGMNLLMNNSNAPLRVIAKQFDDQIIIPHLGRYYDYGMQHAPDDCKGDMQVRARGSTALVQRAIAREFLMQIYPISKDPELKINPEKMAAEMARANGFSLSSIQYTDQEWQAIEQQRAQNPPPGDPRIESARIRAQATAEQIKANAEQASQDRQMRAQEGAADRHLKELLASVEKEIEIMRLSGEENISIGQIKAMLAGKVIDSRDKRELFAAERQLKLDPSNPTNQGV